VDVCEYSRSVKGSKKSKLTIYTDKEISLCRVWPRKIQVDQVEVQFIAIICPTH